MEKKFCGYVVVAWFGGIPYFLQYNGVLSWYFYNNDVKIYRSVGYGIRGVKCVVGRFRCDCVKLYGVYEDDRIGVDSVRCWERDGGRVVYRHSVG